MEFDYSNLLNAGLVWYSNGRFVSGIQMVKSHDLEDHSNTSHFGPLTGFFIPPFEYQTPILSGIQMNWIFKLTQVDPNI